MDANKIETVLKYQKAIRKNRLYFYPQ